jgi:hypothetical protein
MIFRRIAECSETISFGVACERALYRSGTYSCACAKVCHVSVEHELEGASTFGGGTRLAGCFFVSLAA